ncbi:DUF4293 domain-containing protein [Flavobacteriaceae bacterium]|nr:DUF4293 domain-containing protein [Flavobacteriaceae bacterium]
MIQRIQSLYLLLVILLSFIVLYFSLNSPLGIDLNSFFKDIYGFYFIPILGCISLFIYGRRKIQSIICLILIFLNLIVLQVYISKIFEGDLNTIIFIILVSSFVECILLILARRAINKDEKLVSSIDRIR